MSSNDLCKGCRRNCGTECPYDDDGNVVPVHHKERYGDVKLSATQFLGKSYKPEVKLAKKK